MKLDEKQLTQMIADWHMTHKGLEFWKDYESLAQDIANSYQAEETAQALRMMQENAKLRTYLGYFNLIRGTLVLRQDKFTDDSQLPDIAVKRMRELAIAQSEIFKVNRACVTNQPIEIIKGLVRTALDRVWYGLSLNEIKK